MTIGYEYNVSTSLSAGITKVAEPNANVLAVFSNEDLGFSEDYRIYTQGTELAKDCGSDSVTTLMGQTALGQTNGLLAGGGYLVVVKMKNTKDGKAPSVACDIASKIADFKAVTDGVLNVSINGVERESIFMDFSKINTIDDIVKIINDKAFGYTAKVVNSKVVLQTKVVGTAVTFVKATPTMAGTDIGDVGYLDMANGVVTAGADATGETIQNVLTRLDGQVFFHGIATTKVMTTAEKIATSGALAGQEYLFYCDIQGMQDAKEVGEEIVQRGLWNTRLQTNLADDIIENKKLAVGACSKMFSANPNMANVALTMESKIVNGVKGNDRIGLSKLKILLTRGVDVYVKRDEQHSNMITGNANKYTDVAYLSNLIQMLLRINVYNIFLTDTKVSQTDAGRAIIRKAISDTLDKLVRANWLATGETWNGQTFGNDSEFKESIELNGYYIFIVPEITQADREKRKALVQIACKASGAYHGAQLNITLEE